ncbi:MAG TPA: hypothetical protein VM124_03355 [Candidatus Limnocylindrales bacterium]|nr:hypothetical protein [Candidatus Limnocylindrales bacterium]
MTKKFIKISRKQRQKFTRIGVPLLLMLSGSLVGMVATLIVIQSAKPIENIVWAADNTVKIPKSLRMFLEKQHGCEHYKGTDSERGVGLWGVYQVSHDKFAKIAYGCSWSLSPYIMAVKQDDTWQLLQPTDYFAPFQGGIDHRQGALPFCRVVEKYKITKDIESFCINDDNVAIANDL